MVTAKLKYLRIAPRKVRLVARLIKGLPVREAEAQLMLSPRRPALPLLKLLRSAMANAKHNYKLDVEKLFVKEIRVDKGIKFRRWWPRARGAVSPIDKKTSHVTVVLETSEKLPAPRFVIKEKEKKEKSKPVQKSKKEGKEKSDIKSEQLYQEKKSSQETPREGFFKKIFRRKAI